MAALTKDFVPSSISIRISRIRYYVLLKLPTLCSRRGSEKKKKKRAPRRNVEDQAGSLAKREPQPGRIPLLRLGVTNFYLISYLCCLLLSPPPPHRPPLTVELFSFARGQRSCLRILTRTCAPTRIHRCGEVDDLRISARCSVRLKHFRRSSYRACFHVGEKSIRD